MHDLLHTDHTEHDYYEQIYSPVFRDQMGRRWDSMSYTKLYASLGIDKLKGAHSKLYVTSILCSLSSSIKLPIMRETNKSALSQTNPDSQ